MKHVILTIIFMVFAGAVGGYAGWSMGNVDKAGYELQISALQTELEQIPRVIPLEDRFANLMENLSDNYTMNYDIDIIADLHEEDDIPDHVRIILHLNKGDIIQ